MTTTLCVSGACILKAGKNVSSDLTGTTSDAKWTTLINEAEAYLNTITRYDLVGNYASLDAENKKILEMVCSDIAAMYGIIYDMSGYTSRFEAQTMLDVLRDKITDNVKLLQDKVHTDFLVV